MTTKKFERHDWDTHVGNFFFQAVRIYPMDTFNQKHLNAVYSSYPDNPAKAAEFLITEFRSEQDKKIKEQETEAEK